VIHGFSRLGIQLLADRQFPACWTIRFLHRILACLKLLGHDHAKTFFFLILLLAVPTPDHPWNRPATSPGKGRIEVGTRYMAESRVVALARIGDITRKFAEIGFHPQFYFRDRPNAAVGRTGQG
jgi:hypothetical protein